MPSVVTGDKLDNEPVTSGSKALVGQFFIAGLLVIHEVVSGVAKGKVVPVADSIGAVQHFHIGDGNLDGLALSCRYDPPTDNVRGEVLWIVGRRNRSFRVHVQVTAVAGRVVIAVECFARGTSRVGWASARAVALDITSILASGRIGARSGTLVHDICNVLVTMR